MKKLSTVITPNHKDLRIPKVMKPAAFFFCCEIPVCKSVVWFYRDFTWSVRGLRPRQRFLLWQHIKLQKIKYHASAGAQLQLWISWPWPAKGTFLPPTISYRYWSTFWLRWAFYWEGKKLTVSGFPILHLIYFDSFVFHMQANPPSLLSTVQYVSSFFGNRLEGEEQYWWTQFASAIEFIKTMDYSD